MTRPFPHPADARCANCEHADPGGPIETVKTVDCLNPYSDRFTPEVGHVCPRWMRREP